MIRDMLDIYFERVNSFGDLKIRWANVFITIILVAVAYLLVR